MNEEYIPDGSKAFVLVREAYDWIEAGLAALVCCILFFTFIARTIGVVGESMYPTLQDKDRLVSTRIYEELQPLDIVVIAQPNSKDEPLIKRVIAVGGQTIDIDTETGEVYVNGELLYEPYIYEKISAGSRFDVEFPQVVPPGHVFVMGDNRNNSWDSRAEGVGMVDERYILGKVIYRVMPYERFGPPELWREEANRSEG